MFKGFQLVDLHTDSEEKILKDKNAAIVELVLKYGAKRDFRDFLKKYKLELVALFDRKEEEILKFLILYIGYTDKGKDILKELAMLHPGIQPITGSAADRLIKEGRKEGVRYGIEQGIEKGRKEGIEKGMKIEKLAIAKNLLSLNIPFSDVQRATGLSESELKSLI